MLLLFYVFLVLFYVSFVLFYVMFVLFYVLILSFVLFYVLFMCTVLLPLAVNPIAVNKYIISYRISTAKEACQGFGDNCLATTGKPADARGCLLRL